MTNYKKGPISIYLVIYITVCEHSVEILHAFTSCPVVIIFKSLFDRAHVHWVLDDFMIVLNNRTCSQRMITAAVNKV